MPKCAVRRGFLTLKECGEPAIALCSACGRPTCAEHLLGEGPGEGPGPLCVECSASRSFSDDTGSDWDSGPSATWRVGYRDDYYRESGYSPPVSSGVAGGFVTGGSFDDLDKEAFDPALAETELPLADDMGPSLFDS